MTEGSTALKEAPLDTTGGDVGHKSVGCPRQVYGLCERKGNSANICANTVTVITCEEDAKVSDGKTLSGNKKRPSSVIYQASLSTGVVREAILCLFGRWGISPYFATMEFRATCELTA